MCVLCYTQQNEKIVSFGRTFVGLIRNAGQGMLLKPGISNYSEMAGGGAGGRGAGGGGLKIRVTPLLGRKSEREFKLQKQKRNSSRNAREERFLTGSRVNLESEGE